MGSDKNKESHQPQTCIEGEKDILQAEYNSKCHKHKECLVKCSLISFILALYEPVQDKDEDT